MNVRCGRCGTLLDYTARVCSECHAELVDISGNWYWKKAPRTGLEQHWKDENGKAEDIFGNVNPNPKEKP